MTEVCNMASIPTWKPKTGSLAYYRDRDDFKGASDSRQQINSDIPPTKKRDFTSYKRSLSEDVDGSLDSDQTKERSSIERPTVKFTINGSHSDESDDTGEMGKDILQNSTPDNVRVSGNVVTSHLKHVHSNPFFIDYGVPHRHGNIYNTESRPVSIVDENDNDRSEYAPNSGFVNKLRQKFSSLSAHQQETNLRHVPIRKFSSVENLVEPKQTSESSRRYTPRLKTTENINHVKSKPSVPKPPRPPKIAYERKYSDSEAGRVRSRKHSNEHEAPDIKIGRDDIIIIEHSKPPSSPKVDEKTPEMNGQKITPMKDRVVREEMPKPNTVSSFRSMFEKNNASVSRKLLPDAPKVSTTNKPSRLNVNRKENVEKSPVSSPVNKSVDEISKSEQVTEAVTESNLKPSTMKERATEAPRTLDSPVTRKKVYPEKKSIFDSDSNIKSTRKDPVIRKHVQKDNNVLETDRNENKSKVKNDVTVIREDKTEVKLKPQDTNIPFSTPKKSSKADEFFPGRKEIFDSSMIPKSPTLESKENFTSVNVSQKLKSPRSKKAEKLFPEKKQVFDSSQIPSQPANNSNTNKKRRAPKPPSSVPNDVKKKPEPKNITLPEEEDLLKNSDTPKISEIKSSMIRNELPAFASSQSKTSTPIAPPRYANKIAETSSIDPGLELRTKTDSDLSNVNNFSPIEVSSDNSTPTRGIPSVIANRLKKNTSETPDNKKEEEESDDDTPHTLVKPSQLRNRSQLQVSSVPNKLSQESNGPSEVLKDNKSVDTVTNKSTLKPAQSSSIEDLIRKNRDKPAALFDSSNIVPKAKPKPVNGVPPLDLTDLVTEEQNHPYQEGYIPTKIKPCNITVIGTEVSLSTQPLKKTRSGHKLRIQFDDKEVKTHEYQSETSALEEYLRDNPHEKEEAEKEQAEQMLDLGGVDNGESSDEPETPRDTIAMKSNTALSAGELSNYKSKIQVEEYQFGMSLNEPEPEVQQAPEPEPDPDDLNLLPAEDDNSLNFTGTSISDMLF